MVDHVFRRHYDGCYGLELIVDIANLIFQHAYEFFGDVFSLVLLGVVCQFRLLDGVIEALDVVAESTETMLLVLGGA